MPSLFSSLPILAVKHQVASFILQAAAVAAKTPSIASPFQAVTFEHQVVVAIARVTSTIAVTLQGSTASSDLPSSAAASWAITSSATAS